MFWIAVGFAIGFLSGLIGVGGGGLIAVILHLKGLSMPVAIGTSLTQMIPVSSSALFTHFKKKNPDLSWGLWLVPAVMGGVVLGKTIIVHLDGMGKADDVSRLLFIILLGGLGIRMLSPPARSKPSRSKGGNVRYWTGAPVGGVVGLLSGMMGVGGGIFLVPILSTWMGLEMRKAVGTALLCVFGAALFGTLSYGTAGLVDWKVAGLLAAGGFVGGNVGARGTALVNRDRLRRLFALFLFSASLSVLAKQLGYGEAGTQFLIAAIALLFFLGFSQFLAAVLAERKKS